MPNGLQQPATLIDRGFPAEICKRIVRYVHSLHDLTVLARVCVVFQTEAELKLYTTHTLTGYSMVTRMCKVFIDSPRVAGLVRQLCVDLASRQHRSILTSSLLHSFSIIDIVADAISQMPRLEMFYYINPGTPLPRTPVPPIFQLVDVHLECDWDDNLILFLDSQTRLTRLSLGDSMQCPVGIGQDGNLDQVALNGGQIEPPEGLHAGWMPRLKVLRGPWQIVMFLAQGRPIKDIKTKYPPWVLEDYDDEDRFAEFMPTFLKALGSSTGPILKLEMGDHMVDGISLSFLAEAPVYLPALEKIGKLIITDSHYLKFIEHLALMKSLKSVDFAFRGPNASIWMGNLLTHQIAIYASSSLEAMTYHTPIDSQTWRKRRVNPGDPSAGFDEWSPGEIIPKRGSSRYE